MNSNEIQKSNDGSKKQNNDEQQEPHLDYKLVDENYRTYRQSGLGLSATVIALSLLILKWAASGYPHPCSLTFYIQCTLVAFTIGAAISIQWFHYQGYKKQSRYYFSLLEKQGKSEKQGKEAIENFDRGDTAVNVAIILLVVVSILTVFFAFFR